MHEETAPAPGFGDGNWSAAPRRIEDANGPLMHKRVARHVLQEMEFDMIANDAVGFDDSASLAINSIPWPTDLGVQPAAQGPEMFAEPFPILIRAAHALLLRQEFFR